MAKKTIKADSITLTDREKKYLKSLKITEAVADLRVLKKMQQMGHLKLHKQTGMTVYYNGRAIKSWYVDDTIGQFELDNMIFRGKYFSGCFFPYFVRVK